MASKRIEDLDVAATVATTTVFPVVLSGETAAKQATLDVIQTAIGKVGKITVTQPATGSTLTIADGKTLTVSNTLTFTGTDASSVAFGTGGTVLYTSSVVPLTVGTTTIASGTTTRILYDNAGVLGEYTITGTGTVVAMQTSPAFTTPSLGVATATSINKVAITAPATSATLTIADGKTLTANNSLTLAGTDATTMTFPSTSATIARTDAANTFTGVQTFSTPIATGSVATMTATVGGGVPTPPNNTTTFLRGDGTFATPSAVISPRQLVSTSFESSGRFSAIAGGAGGSATFGAGLILVTAANTSDRAGANYQVGTNTTNTQVFNNSPKFACYLSCVTVPGSDGGGIFIGIGNFTITSTLTFTEKHIGFKVVKVSGAYNLYATQGDGSTETSSSILTTVAATDFLELVLQVNGSSSVDYYWSKNSGSISSATNLTTNIPSTSTADRMLTIALSNNGVGAAQAFNVMSMSYQKTT